MRLRRRMRSDQAPARVRPTLMKQPQSPDHESRRRRGRFTSAPNHGAPTSATRCTASARRPRTADSHVAATGTASNAESLETISDSWSKPTAYAEVVEAWPTASIESASILAASSRTSGWVSARSPAGVVGARLPAPTSRASVGMRTTSVARRPGAIAGNSSSGPSAAWGVSTPIRITKSALGQRNRDPRVVHQPLVRGDDALARDDVPVDRPVRMPRGGS
jgi:hypothetical protein